MVPGLPDLAIFSSEFPDFVITFRFSGRGHNSSGIPDLHIYFPRIPDSCSVREHLQNSMSNFMRVFMDKNEENGK